MPNLGLCLWFYLQFSLWHRRQQSSKFLIFKLKPRIRESTIWRRKKTESRDHACMHQSRDIRKERKGETLVVLMCKWRRKLDLWLANRERFGLFPKQSETLIYNNNNNNNNNNKNEGFGLSIFIFEWMLNLYSSKKKLFYIRFN